MSLTGNRRHIFIHRLCPVIYQRKEQIRKREHEHVNLNLFGSPLKYRESNVHVIDGTEAVLNPVAFPLQIDEVLALRVSYVGEGWPIPSILNLPDILS
jgi:hypothetical protein